jgi:hypothetical protein
MTRVCTICTHDAAPDINVDLVRRKGYRTIAHAYGVSQDALKRHAKDHIPSLLVEAYKALERSDAESLATELARQKEDVERLKSRAEADEDYRTALAGVDKALRCLELQARVEQLIRDAPATEVNISLYEHPGYIRLEEALFRALEHHHEARWAVADALKELDDPTSSP